MVIIWSNNTFCNKFNIWDIDAFYQHCLFWWQIILFVIVIRPLNALFYTLVQLCIFLGRLHFKLYTLFSFQLELICIVGCVEKQLCNQLESLTKLYQFTINEMSMSVSYNELNKAIHQTQGKVSVTLDVLKKDIEWCSDSNVTARLQELVGNLHEKERQVWFVIITESKTK